MGGFGHDLTIALLLCNPPEDSGASIRFSQPEFFLICSDAARLPAEATSPSKNPWKQGWMRASGYSPLLNYACNYLK
jgi:hypothetical protein